MKLIFALPLILLAAYGSVLAQQVPDYTFEPKISKPAYPDQNGPVVIVDEAHHNFHTIDGRYAAFAKVLTKDGYLVKPGKQPFTAEGLKGVKNVRFLLNLTHWLDQ